MDDEGCACQFGWVPSIGFAGPGSRAALVYPRARVCLAHHVCSRGGRRFWRSRVRATRRVATWPGAESDGLRAVAELHALDLSTMEPPQGL
jgi:hypothetical protein